MQIKNKSILRVVLLAGSVFTCLIFTSNGLAATPVIYAYPPTTSQIPVPLVEPVPNPVRFPPSLAYGGVRNYTFADFNGDGRVDILVGPTFWTTYPKLPIEIWLQEPGGTFVNRTSDVIEGPVPITGNIAGDQLVADFNEDGRPDVLLVDSGLEDIVCPCDGETNKLLLSQPNGRMVDASWRISPNPLGFHHNGSVADVDGDGHLDVMITDLGIGSLPNPQGVFFLMGDGRGNFTRSESRVPASIRFKTPAEFLNVQDPQTVSGAAFADFDGDGRVDIVSTTGFPDFRTGKRTVRFHRQMTDGTFVEQSRLQIPAALEPFTQLGAWRPGIGDIDGDGLPDLAILWEGNPTYVQLLRNDGNFHFTDITIQAIGSYEPQGNDFFGNKGFIGRAVLADVNRDGFADLVLQLYGVSLDSLLTRSGVFLSEGDGRFSPWSLRIADGSLSADSLGSVLGCRPCSYQPHFFDFDVDGNMDLILVDTISNQSQTATGSQSTAVRLHLFRQVGNPYSVPADFDGDHRSDVAVYRDGTWFILRSLGRGVTATGWGGLAQDVPVPGDYDGDRKTDLAIYRDGVWFIWRSSDNVQTAVGWGTVGDVPVQADYDGDGKTDIAVYRDGNWYIIRSSDGGFTGVGWGGLPQDIPVPADYDGDGKTDIAVYRDGNWYIIRSSDGGFTGVGWGGLAQDIPVPGDYDGDGKTDIAVYRDGTWFILRSLNGGVTVKGWGGLTQDIPVPADYDGDGKTDVAIYRAGTWFIIRSSDGGVTGIGWGGLPQDVPLN